MLWDRVGVLVVSSVSKPIGHNSRGKSRETGLFSLAERHGIIRLTERRNALRFYFPNVIYRF